MKILLLLAALAACYFAVQWLRKKSAETSRRKAVGQRALESRAERDRVDIEALTRSLSEPARSASPDSASTDSATAGVAREERSRRAAAYSSFDPDLPAPVKDSATRS